MHRKLAMGVKPVATMVSPDPVFTAGKEYLTEMVNQAWSNKNDIFLLA